MTVSDILNRAADLLEARGWDRTSRQVFALVGEVVGGELEDHEAWAAAIELARCRAIPPEQFSWNLLGNWLMAPERTQAQVLAVLRGEDWRAL
jgi:hypothetical protein